MQPEPAPSGFRSLTTRLIVWVLLSCGLVFVLTLAVSHRHARALAVRSAEREARSEADGAVHRVREALRSTELGVGLLSTAIAALDAPRDRLDGLLGQVLAEHPGLHAMAVVFPGVRGQRPSAVFARRDAGAGVATGTLAGDAGWEERPWFREAVDRRGPYWSEPGAGPAGGATPVVAYSVPVFGPPGEGEALRAVVVAELDLGRLNALAREIHAGRSGFGVILSGGGRILAHPDASLLGRAPLDDMPAEQREALEPVVRRMLRSESAFEPLAVGGRTFRLAFAPVGMAGWSLAVLYPEDELLAGVRRLRLLQAALVAGGLALLAAVVVMLSRRITRPLRALADSAAQLATGNLDQDLPPVRSRDELGALLATFHHMRDALRDHIRDLQQVTAARERMESELRVARRIQVDMLAEPRARGDGFELAATLLPARAVGGDLYDHFVRGGRVYFMVGDVSGKGIAAALFMARARGLLEVIAAREDEPGAILARLNHELCAENDAGMYLTAVLCALDAGTGELAFACAGHEPPVRIPEHGAPVALRTAGGPVLGLIDGRFPVERVALSPRDTLVLYTDGVHEAQDKAGEFFGADRLRAAVVGAAQLGTEPLARRVLGAVQAFAGEAPQSDDITILVARYAGPARAAAGPSGVDGAAASA